MVLSIIIKFYFIFKNFAGYHFVIYFDFISNLQAFPCRSTTYGNRKTIPLNTNFICKFSRYVPFLSKLDVCSSWIFNPDSFQHLKRTFYIFNAWIQQLINKYSTYNCLISLVNVYFIVPNRFII